MSTANNPEDTGPLRDEWDAASAEEQKAAARLRDALERAASEPCPDLDFIQALRSAARPRAIDPERHEAVLAKALAPRTGKAVYPLFAAAAALAIAAGAAVVFVARDQAEHARPPAAAHAIPGRSAADLFDGRFPVTGGTSTRVDRIATAREREMRDNMFAQWQVP